MKPTICLNMIVKNESRVIRRCLQSVRKIINTWVIVDTGSTDGTQTIIREFMKDIHGELHELPWVNFGHNRNEALVLARGKADYILFIDADDRLVFDDSFVLPYLDKDVYYVKQVVKGRDNAVTEGDIREIVLMVKDLPVFYWEGIMHEGVACYEARSKEVLAGVINEYLHDGGRSQDPDRFKKDVAMLEKALENDPENLRHIFYLAQAYACDQNYKKAIEYYEKTASISPYETDVFYALFYIAIFQRIMRGLPEVFLRSFSKAYLSRPSRVEPLCDIAGYFFEIDEPFIGYLVTKFTLSTPLPPATDPIVQAWVYDWGLLWFHYQFAVRLEKKKTASIILQKLLANPRLPEEKKRALR